MTFARKVVASMFKALATLVSKRAQQVLLACENCAEATFPHHDALQD